MAKESIPAPKQQKIRDISNSFHIGYDCYTPDCGTKDEMFCKVCNTKMLVERDKCDTRSFVQAMSGSKSSFDWFYCPNYDNDWHRQIIALMQEMRETASKKIKAILQEEINEIIQGAHDRI